MGLLLGQFLGILIRSITLKSIILEYFRSFSTKSQIPTLQKTDLYFFRTENSALPISTPSAQCTEEILYFYKLHDFLARAYNGTRKMQRSQASVSCENIVPPTEHARHRYAPRTQK